MRIFTLGSFVSWRAFSYMTGLIWSLPQSHAVQMHLLPSVFFHKASGAQRGSVTCLYSPTWWDIDLGPKSCLLISGCLGKIDSRNSNRMTTWGAISFYFRHCTSVLVQPPRMCRMWWRAMTSSFCIGVALWMVVLKCRCLHRSRGCPGSSAHPPFQWSSPPSSLSPWSPYPALCHRTEPFSVSSHHQSHSSVARSGLGAEPPEYSGLS